MIGKTVEEAKQLLISQGVDKIKVVNNFEHEIEGSKHLVTACKIDGKTATLVVGSFKLDL